jgi:ABC-type transport system involved in multi-copper enzyme maturation permease subunit
VQTKSLLTDSGTQQIFEGRMNLLIKELKEVRWKLILALLLFVAFVATSPFPYKELSEDSGPGLPAATAPDATEFLFMLHRDGEIVVALLAAILGAGLISSETKRGTIFLLLSKPVGRTRVFIAKYVVGALALLVAITLGSVGLVAVESMRGWPVGSLSVLGVSLSALLFWLGGLFVFGVALLASAVFEDAIRSTSAALVAGLLTFRIPVGRGDDGLNPLPQTLVLPDFWHDPELYAGEKLVPVSFLVCLFAAVAPLVVALWVFRRKAY